MLLISTAWRPSTFESGVIQIIPPNYGGYGGLIGYGDDFRHTPTEVPDQAQTVYDPHIPQWNSLVPIIWNEYVLHADEVAALQQAGLIQLPEQLSATFTPPGTASLTR